jgi:hypothetical protein
MAEAAGLGEFFLAARRGLVLLRESGQRRNQRGGGEM